MQTESKASAALYMICVAQAASTYIYVLLVDRRLNLPPEVVAMPAEACRTTCTTRVELVLCLHSILNLDLYSQGCVSFIVRPSGSLNKSDALNTSVYIYRWYAVRLSVQPCAPSDCLRVTTNAQRTGQ